MIRPLNPDDLFRLKRIHEKHYQSEFSFPDFDRNFLCCYAVETNGKIVSAGGVRTIAETILITDKDMSTRERRDALYEILSASAYFADKAGYDQLHAFVQDDVWEKQLIKAGFNRCKGNALYINVNG